MTLYTCFFFFKQKTAYEMRISDWSSDVCSSDLFAAHQPRHLVGEDDLGLVDLSALKRFQRGNLLQGEIREQTQEAADVAVVRVAPVLPEIVSREIGSASCRERVCQYV